MKPKKYKQGRAKDLQDSKKLQLQFTKGESTIPSFIVHMDRKNKGGISTRSIWNLPKCPLQIKNLNKDVMTSSDDVLEHKERNHPNICK